MECDYRELEKAGGLCFSPLRIHDASQENLGSNRPSSLLRLGRLYFRDCRNRSYSIGNRTYIVIDVTEEGKSEIKLD